MNFSWSSFAQVLVVKLRPVGLSFENLVRLVSKLWNNRPKRVVLLTKSVKNTDWVRLGNDLVTVTFRPAHGTGQPHHSSEATKCESEIAIVVQGPIMNDLDFTFHTVRQYRNLFPQASLILSTWADEPGLSRFSGMCEVIASDRAKIPAGWDSSNLQMHSSHVGVMEAKRIGAKYVLKTRSDQRINDNFSLQSLRNLHDYFPVKADSNQIGRLLSVSLDTFLYRLYGVSDMFTFGRIEDVQNFWNGEHPEANTKLVSAHSLAKSRFIQLNEVQYCSAFLERVGEVPDWTVEHYWKTLRERFLILDSSSVALSWPKYSALENRWARAGSPPHLEEVTFAKWLAIKSFSLPIDPGLADLTDSHLS